jgi:hypothetical protein
MLPRFPALAALAAFSFLTVPLTAHAIGDRLPLSDPARPVSEIGPTSVTLQWFTPTPCPTRAQIREGDLPVSVWRPEGNKAELWTGPGVRVAEGDRTPTTYHVLRVTGLRPGRRHFYRVFDPGAKPTAQEAAWGAKTPWRREYAVATLGGKGRKTVVRIPVKVLLMPNVVNVASARRPDGTWAPLPPSLNEADLKRVRDEYAATSRFFWVNSGMRYWVDFQIFVDDRPQRWGDDAPSDAPATHKGLPVCRSYSGQDFRAPGGGTWTILDTADPRRANDKAVYEERPYAGQVEQAFARRWDDKAGKWVFYGSGGGTFGVDGFPRGVPGRSQYLGGSDTAWLAAHEFHHQMESEGAFFLSDREDDRIVFDHPAPRRREGEAWRTAGPHGEHWDVLAYWDRTLTDAQWLRCLFGEAVTVADRDEDGVPDNDPRLPLDEKRWGSSADKPRTDGRLGDLAKVMLSTWAPGPLQATWGRAPFQAKLPKPRDPDSDGDGQPDDTDPYPLYPHAPFVWPLTATVDGDASEWAAVPLAGKIDVSGGVGVTFRQAHDDARYYACFTLRGPWRRLRVTLDGEGDGVFSGGVQGLTLTRGENGGPPVVKPEWGEAPGMEVKVSGSPGDKAEYTVEVSLPNRGEGRWFWRRGGRPVGTAVEVTDRDGAAYSMYEPYRLFYATMLEAHGRPALPTGAPAELTADQATRILRPGDPALKLSGNGWTVADGALRHRGHDESAAYVEAPGGVGDFDLWVRLEAKSDAVLAAFTPETREMSAGRDYVAFVGGYGNAVTRLRLFGREAGDDDMALTPGEHTVQLSRRAGAIWCLYDGRPVLYAADPDPKKRLDRLAVIGGYNGDQAIREIRVRYAPAAP